jgi:hypothetical protein
MHRVMLSHVSSIARPGGWFSILGTRLVDESKWKKKEFDNLLHDDFDFAIVNFHFLCSNIVLSPTYGVYISQFIQYTIACFACADFSKRVNY